MRFWNIFYADATYGVYGIVTNRLNSSTRVDLPVQPSGLPDDIFHELLVVYKAVRAIQFGLSGYDIKPILSSPADLADADLLTYYQLSRKAKYIAKAASAIAAGDCVCRRIVGDTLEVMKCFIPGVPNSRLNFFGIALTDAAAGEAVLVMLSPGILSGLSGLIPGRLLFTADNGGLSYTAIIGGFGRWSALNILSPTDARIMSHVNTDAYIAYL